mmetsp:Transcript_34471/g.93428  ORF Transcript_34471/g.93428 Transcript_34471/m.93428 type:complete len:233 (-) Transcript_34471:1099-1797(-)
MRHASRHAGARHGTAGHGMGIRGRAARRARREPSRRLRRPAHPEYLGELPVARGEPRLPQGSAAQGGVQLDKAAPVVRADGSEGASDRLTALVLQALYAEALVGQRAEEAEGVLRAVSVSQVGDGPRAFLDMRPEGVRQQHGAAFARICLVEGLSSNDRVKGLVQKVGGFVAPLQELRLDVARQVVGPDVDLHQLQGLELVVGHSHVGSQAPQGEADQPRSRSELEHPGRAD